MPCIFCIAVFATLAGTIGAAVIDELEQRLATETGSPINKTAESDSTARLEFDFPLADGEKTKDGKASIPIVMTIYKKTKRVRIQVMTHAIDRSLAQAVQRRIAEIAALEVESYSEEESEELVHDAMDGHTHDDEEEKNEQKAKKGRARKDAK